MLVQVITVCKALACTLSDLTFITTMLGERHSLPVIAEENMWERPGALPHSDCSSTFMHYVYVN
jgi:hypothetical protein